MYEIKLLRLRTRVFVLFYFHTYVGWQKKDISRLSDDLATVVQSG